MSEKKKVYTLEEVSKHVDVDDLWLAIDGKVYDVTAFLEEHPGGDGVLLDNAGTDSTEAFDDVGHSEDAIETLKQFYIGDLEGYQASSDGENNPKIRAKAVRASARTVAPQPALWKQIAVPVLIVAVGLALRFYFTASEAATQDQD
eukprot:CAMPEP_0174249840 /NCGR_PEP_ID=MMETSP0439-20130205/180_1 /TAXON_ID=0 /ORGANISM="Stereomyxa ramosa, Strain Chinc5" /LENGTH=145 /DNA_ID=CAMNT_0015329755 /DNA_START=61 /DNA_END=498 /DNA_ORIENTATION=-